MSTLLSMGAALQPEASTNGPRPFVPGFGVDVFVSYGHADNEAELWVEKLYRRLKAEVESILGEPVQFWIDPQLNGGEILDSALKRRVSSTAIFLPVLSPRYVKSPYCCQELQWFLDSANERGFLSVGDRCRILPVEKYPPPELPPGVARLNLVSTRFHVTDATSRMISTFAADDGLPGFPHFYETYKKLAADLAATLVDLRHAQTATRNTGGKAIFVAAVAPTKRSERERLVNYLSSRGFRVTGSPTPPETLDELSDSTGQDLEGASLAVHLVGASYGIVPDGEETKSAVWLQYEQAKRSGKRQLVWIGDEGEKPSARQKALLDVLANSADSQTEICQCCLAEFLESLPEELDKLTPKAKQRDSGGVYLLCDRADLADQQLKALREFFEEEGFPVVHPAFQGDAGLLRELEEESIAENDATVMPLCDAQREFCSRCG